MKKIVLSLMLVCLITLTGNAMLLAHADSLGGLLGGLNGFADMFSDDEDNADDTVQFSGPLVEVEINGKTIEVRQDFLDVMNAYEAFFDEYIACLNNPDDLTKLTGMMMQYESTLLALEQIEDSELSDDESIYFYHVYNRIMENLMIAAK